MAKFKFAEWLLVWLQDAEDFEFEWDDGNWAKSAKKHGVSAAEIEEVFTAGRAAPLGIQVSPAVPEERMAVVGATAAGRVLHLVFTIRDGRVRPISARPAAPIERGFYEAWLH